MQKKERISLYKALIFIGVLCLITFFFFFNRQPKNFSYNPLNRALSYYEKGDYQKASVYFAQADLLNLPEAAFALGAMNFTGKGMPVNITKALDYYEKAADAGYAPAQMTMALIYINGENVLQDFEKGLQYAQKAAENGDAEAQIMLARWYENGEYVEKNMKKAVYFYQKAARQGDINAKMALAVIYKNGSGNISENIHTAKRWEKSIDQQKKFENIFLNRSSEPIKKAK